MNEIILVNITWNKYGWVDNTYINPKAGHSYAKSNVGGEALNFHFNKKSIDTSKHVFGFIKWTNAPIRFETGGLVIFFTKNTEKNIGQIVGLYGKAEIFREVQGHKTSFQKTEYWTNVKAEKAFSLRFPIPLNANNYKESSSNQIVGQIGFAYKDEHFAERVLFDELTEISKAGTNENDYNKLIAIYEFYIRKKFITSFISNDQKEQNDLEQFYKGKTKVDIIKELQNLKETDPEEIIVNHKTYKRDNKTIAQIKVLRDFKCQICSTTIIKKDGSKYIEAAHIVPKHQKGRETLDNLILLCPNHHKEFDFGNLEIKLHDINKIEFLLNGQKHKIKLSID